MKRTIYLLLFLMLAVSDSALSEDSLKGLQGTWVSANFASVSGSGTPNRTIRIYPHGKTFVLDLSFTKVQRITRKKQREPSAHKTTITNYQRLPYHFDGAYLTIEIPDLKTTIKLKRIKTEKGVALKDEPVAKSDDNKDSIFIGSLANPFYKEDE